ncbi:DUF6064 family protein [Thiorhodococcus minor]|uniref:MFS transporter permease n=1 Tax=Thiorhodococcus minor TaxID=57489 RepID=A0A6M0K7N2_9GAMM|nr:DUF6064 family protein [Thiorhodococcus minor]NEV64667.1 hypothetical protein [Thiorhodococcus minor]
MGELETYALIDFIPFEAEAYFRLFARQNLSIWPSQLLTLPLGLLALWLAWRGRARPLGILLGLCWIWVGISFHLRLYAELSWAATYVGWAFIVAGLLLMALALPIGARTARTSGLGTKFLGGIGLGLSGLALYPLMPLVTQLSWQEAQVFGVAPDATTLVTLGCLLMTGRPTWPLAILPLAWCCASGATWLALGWMPGLLLPVGGLIFIALALWPSFERPAPARSVSELEPSARRGETCFLDRTLTRPDTAGARHEPES